MRTESASSELHPAAEGGRVAKFAHELGNMLDGSMRNVGLVLRKLEQVMSGQESLATDAADRLKQVSLTMRQMAGLLSQLALPGQSPALSWPDATLLEALGRAIQAIEPLAEQYNVRIDVVVPSAMSRLPAGPLYPALLNGLRNAVEAVGPGGMVRVRGRKMLDQGEITIEDNGPGLDARLQRDAAGLFEPGTTTKPHGHGMGLVVSREALQQMGGTLRLMDGARGGAVLKMVWKLHWNNDAPAEPYINEDEDERWGQTR